MAHYSIEIKGAAPVDWELLRAQRDTLTKIEHHGRLEPSEEDAVVGVRNLLDAMLDTHDDCAKADEAMSPVENDETVRPMGEHASGDAGLAEYLGAKPEDGDA